MKSKLFSNRLQQNRLRIVPTKDKLNQQRYLTNLNYSTPGFTLLEVLVTILIVGILSAIAAPSWLGFVARQRLNKANDSVLAALQDAQRQAKKTKRSYSVSFRENNKIVEFAVYPTKKLDANGTDVKLNEINIWKPLGGELEIQSDKLIARTNLKADNTADTHEPSYDFKISKKITFDHMGNLPSSTKMGKPKTSSSEPPGLKITVAIPKSGNATQASDVKRCVIVKTLIGGIQTAKNDDCS